MRSEFRMMKGIIYACLLGLLPLWTSAQDLVEEQLQYPRVREARDDYDAALRERFAAKGVAYPPKEIYLRAFKFDMEMELWASDGGAFRLIKTYPICNVSGKLGPKRQQGDGQIPEGFYELSQFNPVSNYHLSLKVNYPNNADRILSHQTRPGGDIFIHGDCVTIGCIPIRDEPIKELFWLALMTAGNGGIVPIHIFPFRMDAESVKFFRRLPVFSKKDWEFWGQLSAPYEYFESTRQLPAVKVLPDGRYALTEAAEPIN